jgi:hypothetical protein
MKPLSLPFRYISICLCLFIVPYILQAQLVRQPILDKGSIDTQFTSLLTNSSQYEYNGVLYKGIKIGHLTILKANINDTLKTLQKKLLANQQTIVSKNYIIDSLNKELGNTNEMYLTTKKEKNSLRFLGITFSKTAYNSLLWTVIFGLLFLLVIIILFYRRNNSVTIQTKKDLEELKKDYENHRKRSLEREEKLARQHLDELNKYKK